MSRRRAHSLALPTIRLNSRRCSLLIAMYLFCFSLLPSVGVAHKTPKSVLLRSRLFLSFFLGSMGVDDGATAAAVFVV